MSHRFVLLSGIVVALAGPGRTALAQARFERASVSSAGAEADGSFTGIGGCLSADGRHVAFESYAKNLAPYDINNTLDVFVRDRVAGRTVLISAALTGLSANKDSHVSGISASGRYVVFWSSAYDLVKFDTNNYTDTFVRDRDPDGNGIFDEGNETTARVSVDSAGGEGNGESRDAAVSDDGTVVAFTSYASNLVAGDTNGNWDIFVRDLTTGVTTLESVSSLGAQGDGESIEPSISGDGASVCFSSLATTLVPHDTNQYRDVFIRDRLAGTTGRASVRSDGGEADSDCKEPRMSSDGNRVVFWSDATDLVPGDTNRVADVFLRDRVAGTITRISVSEAGVEGDSESREPGISRNGEYVVFTSNASNLVGAETNHRNDVFLYEVATGELRKVSVYRSGLEGSGGSFGYEVSDDGLAVTMMEDGFDLIGGDANGIVDLLVRDLTVPDPQASWNNYGAGWPGTLGVPSLVSAANPVMGTTEKVVVANSLGFFTTGFLMIGFAEASVPTNLGGTLLVGPAIVQPFQLVPAGVTLAGLLPYDDALAGTSVFVQVLELDSGASQGVSFTPGLELVLGQ